MNYIEKYLELVPNATSFEKEVMQEMSTHIEQEMREEYETKILGLDTIIKGQGIIIKSLQDAIAIISNKPEEELLDK